MTKKKKGDRWRVEYDLKAFGPRPQRDINRLQMQKRNKRIKITLAPVRGAQ